MYEKYLQGRRRRKKGGGGRLRQGGPGARYQGAYLGKQSLSEYRYGCAGGDGENVARKRQRTKAEAGYIGSADWGSPRPGEPVLPSIPTSCLQASQGILENHRDRRISSTAEPGHPGEFPARVDLQTSRRAAGARKGRHQRAHELQLPAGFFSSATTYSSAGRKRDTALLPSTGASCESCDVFFYNTGLKLGVDNIHEMAEAIGITKPTGHRPAR